jgi:lysozyme
MPIIGIDISKYQGKVDFAKVKNAGITYIFIRATEGITYQDVDYKSNYLAANAAGLTVGAYHFYETNDDPAAQLSNFTALILYSLVISPLLLILKSFTIMIN